MISVILLRIEFMRCVRVKEELVLLFLVARNLRGAGVNAVRGVTVKAQVTRSQTEKENYPGPSTGDLSFIIFTKTNLRS